jgi:hypothetical protein
MLKAKARDASEESPTEGRFVHEVPFVVDFDADREIRLRFEVARKIYNALLGEALRRVRRVRHAMRQHYPVFQKCKAEATLAITENELHPASLAARKITKKAYSPYNELRKPLLREYGCSRFGLSAYGTKLSRDTPLWARQHAIGATVVQELVRRAWLTAEKNLLNPRIKCKFMRYGELRSVESMNEADAIRIADDRIIWSSGKGGGVISMRMRLDRKGRDWVEYFASYAEIIKTRLVRRDINGRKRGAAQIVLAGDPVDRPWITTIPGDDIGIDLGLSVVAIDSDSESAIYSLTTVTPEQRAELALKQRRTNRALDRSRRASNPDKYDEKGRALHRRTHKRLKTESAPRLRWNFSTAYRQMKADYAEASRIVTERRKNATRTLVNHIATLGNVAVIENLSLQKWQQEYGKATGFAPGEFTAALDRRMKSLNGDLHKIPAHTAKLSQFCIACGVYEKRDFEIRVLERRQRCSSCGSNQGGVQADLVQAFLARHVRVEGTIDVSQAQKAWPGASMRLGSASSVVKNAAKTVLARSRRWRNRLAAEQRAVQSGSASPLGPESLCLGKRGESVSVKVPIDLRAARWGSPRAGPLDPATIRKKRPPRSVPIG